MVHPTDRFEVRLRRYGGEGCPGPYGYHNAVSAPIERVQSDEYPVTGDLHAHDDARWPVKCDYCEHVFCAGDVWQRSVERIFVADDGREMLLSDRVPGMMYFLQHRHRLSPHYTKDWAGKRKPIQVVCPNGKEWCVDAISSNGDGWVVTGEPPCLTCSPSIGVPGYHGFLQGGVFTEDLGGF